MKWREAGETWTGKAKKDILLGGGRMPGKRRTTHLRRVSLCKVKDGDDWLDYRLGMGPRFLERVARARASLKAGGGVRLEEIPR